MTDPGTERGPTMQGPATYRIRVLGRIDPGALDLLGGMTLPGGGAGTRGRETVLEGRLADQAALAGVLSALYEMHLPVVSVECLECDAHDPSVHDG